MIYCAKNLNIGFVSDSHNQNERINKVLFKHPEITEWFHLGDLTCFDAPGFNKNKETQAWYKENKNKFVAFLKSNHDHVTAKSLINIDYDFAWELACHPKQVKVVLPNGDTLMLYHSRPDSFWDFTDKEITEREFVDVYPTDDIRAVVIGHNHSPFIKNFVDTDAEIWSVGAIQQGSYAVMKDGKIQLKRI
jgi:predicted phosphodiesterase